MTGRVFPTIPAEPGPGLNGGRCAAQHRHRTHGWVQCARKPGHEGKHRWGTDNQVTEARPFA